MKRILIGLLLITFVTFYIVQKKQIQDYFASLSPRDQVMEQVIPWAVPKVKKSQQEVKLLAYPPPPDEPLLPYPPPRYKPIRTPFPTPTLRPTPTYAPTMNPWND